MPLDCRHTGLFRLMPLLAAGLVFGCKPAPHPVQSAPAPAPVILAAPVPLPDPGLPVVRAETEALARDAIVLAKIRSDEPMPRVTKVQPAEFVAGAQFGGDCLELARYLQLEPSACDAPQNGVSSGAAGPAKLQGVQFTKYHFITAKVECEEPIVCRHDGEWNDVFEIGSEAGQSGPFRWSWFVRAKDDTRGKGLIKVTFGAAATRAGPFEPLRGTLGTIVAPVDVVSEFQAFSHELTGWYNGLLTLFGSLTTLLTTAFAFRSKIASLLSGRDKSEPPAA